MLPHATVCHLPHPIIIQMLSFIHYCQFALPICNTNNANVDTFVCCFRARAPEDLSAIEVIIIRIIIIIIIIIINQLFISISNGYCSRLSLYFGIQWLPLTIITLPRHPMVTANNYHFISVSNGYCSRLSLYFGIQWLLLAIITLSRHPMVTANNYHFISVPNGYC